MRSTKKGTLGDIEERASQLAEAAQRFRDRTYAGARVLEIAQIAEVSANNLDASANRPDRSATLRPACAKLTAESSTQVETVRKVKVEKKAEKTVKLKKERRGDDDKIAVNKRDKPQVKSSKSPQTLREASSTGGASEDDDHKLGKAGSHKKTARKSKKSKSASESEDDSKERKKRKKKKERREKHKVKKRHKLELTTDDSSEGEQELSKKKKKHRVETESGSTSDGDDSDSESDVATNQKSEKQGNGRRFKKWLTLEKFDGTVLL